MPYTLTDVSAAPGSSQAWVLAGRGPGGFPGYLLHFCGLNWTTAVTFRRDVNVHGVSAVSGRVAWLWGDMGGGIDWAVHRPFLALVSGGTVHQVRAAFLTRVFISAVAADGPADAWLAGEVRDRGGRYRGLVVAQWDGTSWHEVPVPAGVTSVTSLSVSGRSDAWAVAGRRFLAWQWLLHWDGVAWSWSYRPAASLSRAGSVPFGMSLASSAGRAWLVYTETSDNSGSNAPPGPPPRPISAYFDGRLWRTGRVPAVGSTLGEVTMAGPDAWAIVGWGKQIRGILHSHLGGGWSIQPLPRPGTHSACPPSSVSAASPTYVIAVSAFSSGPCHRSFAYVYDGHRWRSADPYPAG